MDLYVHFTCDAGKRKTMRLASVETLSEALAYTREHRASWRETYPNADFVLPAQGSLRINGTRRDVLLLCK